jgi:hypothetical protein
VTFTFTFTVYLLNVDKFTYYTPSRGLT